VNVLFSLNRLFHSPVSKLASVFLITLSAPLVSTAQNRGAAVAKTIEVPTYRVGGTLIAIPQPTRDFVETDSDNRKLLEVGVPDSNRLVAAFVLTNDLTSLKSGSNQKLSRYAMVEVQRNSEFADFSASDFKGMTDSASKELGSLITSTSSTKETEDEFNRKVEALHLDAKVSLDKPVSLGCLFSKQDAYGFGMLMAFTSHGTTTNMINGTALVRIKNRLVFAYVYAVYRDQDSLQWVRKVTENWADAILQANQQ